MELTALNAVYVALVEAVAASFILPDTFPNSSLTAYLGIFLSLNLFIFSIYKVVIYPFLLSPLRHLPQPGGFFPFIGHGWILFSRPPGAVHLKMINNLANEGLILFRGFFHTDRLVLTNPASIADVLVHNNYDYEKPRGAREFLKKFLGDGLLMTEGDEHKYHRKQIMPAFHFRHIKELYPVFWAKSIEFCNAVRKELRDEPSKVIEIGHFSTQVTLDIIGLAGLGRDIGSLRNSEDELIENYEEILEPTKEKAVFFLLHLFFPGRLIAMLPWNLNKRVKVTTGNLKRICTDFVVDRKSQMKHETQQSNDILSLMIRSNNFSDENLVDQLLTFLAAGHETTSSALTWATMLLSQRPEHQKKLRAEIYEHISSPNVLSDLTSGADIANVLENMPFLNGVCNEVLRLYPTIPTTARVAVRDTKIGYNLIPKDTMIFIVPWAINRSTKLWGPDAGEFVPERWIDPATGRATMNGGADSNYAFLTFLHGPRSCIGERFARAELRALLAALVGAFEFQMADPTEKVIVGGTVTSKPVNGMRLKLVPQAWGN